MLSSNSWRALSNEMYKRFSTGAGVIFFEMGKSYGSELGTSLFRRAEVARANSVPFDFSYLVTKAGWGNVSRDGDLEHGSHISIVVTHCVFCEGDDNLEHHCPFLKGACFGIASVMYKREYDVSATCSLNKKGEHICKFELYGK